MDAGNNTTTANECPACLCLWSVPTTDSAVSDTTASADSSSADIGDSGTLSAAQGMYVNFRVCLLK